MKSTHHATLPRTIPCYLCLCLLFLFGSTKMMVIAKKGRVPELFMRGRNKDGARIFMKSRPRAMFLLTKGNGRNVLEAGLGHLTSNVKHMPSLGDLVDEGHNRFEV